MKRKIGKIVFIVLLLGLGVTWIFLPPFQREIASLEIERPFYHYFELWKNDNPDDLPDSATVYQSVVDGANWIVNMQEKSGRFNYWYNIDEEKFSSKYEDNFLRQAGTAYSLSMVYELTKDTTYLNATYKSLYYQFNFLEQIDDKAYFNYREKAKLGGTALPMLTMLKLRKLAGDTTNDATLALLANMIIHLQNAYGTGQFKSTYVYRGDYEYEKTNNWESEIYPGEAMLALAFMYQQFPDPRYKEAFDKALAFYYSDDYDWKSGPFIPWTVSACVEMYTVAPEQHYVDFALDMMHSDFYWQNMNASKSVAGSQYGYPTVFASTSQEALGDVMRLCQITRDTARMDEYKYRARLAYRWLISLQYHGDDVNGKGGFVTNPMDSEIRIDNTQHTISALTKGLWYLY